MGLSLPEEPSTSLGFVYKTNDLLWVPLEKYVSPLPGLKVFSSFLSSPLSPFQVPLNLPLRATNFIFPDNEMNIME